MKILEYIQFTKEQREEFRIFDKAFPYKLSQGIIAMPASDEGPEYDLILIRCDPADEEKFRKDTKKIEEYSYILEKAMKMPDGIVDLIFLNEYEIPQRGKVIRKMVYLYLELVENWPKFWRISWNRKCSCCGET